MGFRYILDGLNAERALIAAACTGDGHWFLECARSYVGEGVVFDRFIGQNQRIHFSLASAYVNIQVVNLMRFEACRGYNAQLEWAVQANKANLLSANASSEAGNAIKKTAYSVQSAGLLHIFTNVEARPRYKFFRCLRNICRLLDHRLILNYAVFSSTNRPSQMFLCTISRAMFSVSCWTLRQARV